MDANSLSVVISKFGSYDCLEVKPHPIAELEENEVEVKVAFCGVNFADLYMRQGLFPSHPLPFVLGIECSGIVSNIGDKVKQVKIGDRVICYNYHGGLYTEKLRINEDKCFTIPADINLKDGSAFFVNYLTAYFAISQLGNLKENQVIFIPSCVGGVGWAATELAKLIPNVKIVGSSSESKINIAKENGVHEILNNNTLNESLLEHYQNKFDLIIDTYSGEISSIFEKCLRPLGKIIVLGANNLLKDDKQISINDLIASQSSNDNVSKTSLIINNRSIAGLHLGILAEKEPSLIKEALNIMCNLYITGKIKPKIDSVWNITDIVKATERLGNRLNVGKVLLQTNNILE